MDRDPATVPLDELDRLWDFDDPAGSERRFSELLERARIEQGGALLAEVLTQVARARVMRSGWRMSSVIACRWCSPQPRSPGSRCSGGMSRPRVASGARSRQRRRSPRSDNGPRSVRSTRRPSAAPEALSSNAGGEQGRLLSLVEAVGAGEDQIEP